MQEKTNESRSARPATSDDGCPIDLSTKAHEPETRPESNTAQGIVT